MVLVSARRETGGSFPRDVTYQDREESSQSPFSQRETKGYRQKLLSWLKRLLPLRSARTTVHIVPSSVLSDRCRFKNVHIENL